MSVVAQRVAVYLPTLFQQSGRLSIRFDLPRRKFTALTRGGGRIIKSSDVIGDISKAFGRRCTHGKGETSQDVTFVLLRWSKQIWDKMFGKYLLVTNVLGSGVLMVVGDVIVQEYEYRHGLQQQDRYDGARMYRMFVAGALQAPLQHFVYKWMDRIMPHRTFINIMRKILIDQLFMSPACIVIFFYSTCYLERQTLQETNQELISKFPYIYLMDWLTWPAAQYINFRYLDTKYRVAFVNVYTAVYNVLLSYIKHDFGIQLPLEPNSSSVSPKTADTTEVSTTASKTTS